MIYAAVTSRSPRVQFAGFLAKFSPEIQKTTKAALVKMRARVPGAVELVYDNYNALVVGFSPNGKTWDSVFSIAVYPRWINLFFLQNALDLDDPEKLLQGSGKVVRSIRLTAAADLDKPAVRALMRQAMAMADTPYDRRAKRSIVIRAVSTKQRSRRP